MTLAPVQTVDHRRMAMEVVKMVEMTWDVPTACEEHEAAYNEMVPSWVRVGEEEKDVTAQGAMAKWVTSRKMVENFVIHIPYNVAWAAAVERRGFGVGGRSNKPDNDHMKVAAASGEPEKGGD